MVNERTVRTWWRCFWAISGLLVLLEARAVNVELVVFAGQSNMTGAAADTGDLASSPVDAGVDYYFDTQGASSAVTRFTSGGVFVNGLTGVSMVANVGDPVPLTNRFGPEYGFARKVDELDSAFNLAVAKISFGNSKIADWQKGAPGAFGDAYGERLVAGINQATAAITGAGNTPVIRGLVWFQGESDAFDGGAAAGYGANFAQMISDLRTDLGIANLPVTVIQTSTPVAGFNGTVQTAQADFVSGDANAVLVTTSDLGLNADNRHFESAEMLTIGERAGQAFYQSFVAVPEPAAGIWAALALLSLCGWRRFRSRA